tara:strand:+ start:26153 stop:28708 length:2556 start_codon:yes stop_codon:yes gene_type:complete
MSTRIIVDLDRAGKLESEIERKLNSGQSIGSVMNEALDVTKNEIFQTEELGGSATVNVDVINNSATNFAGESKPNSDFIQKKTVKTGADQDIELDPIDYENSYFKNRDYKPDNVNLQPNVLHKYRSFNTVWSMFVLNHKEMEDPDNTYMTSEPQTVVIRGAGGIQNYQSERRPKTRLERQGGKVEYYIEDVNIKSVIGSSGPTRMPPVHNFNFTVKEPYSMGQFLELIQIAAMQAGYPSYIGAPFCLMCEFIGHTDDDRIERAGKRFFPILLSQSNMTVDQGGTVYECPAISTSMGTNADSVQTIKQDITIIGGTVEEALQSGSQSLTRVINSALLARESKEEGTFSDEYIILFPKAKDLASKKFRGDISGEAEGQATYDPEKEYASRYGETTSVREVDYETWVKNVTGFAVKRSKTSDALKANTLKQENINEIGKGLLLSDKLGKGGVRPGNYFASYDAEKNVFEQGAITIPQDKRAFKFEKGTKVNQIIEEMVVSSEWGKGVTNRPTDDAGFRDWFTIQTKMYMVPIESTANKKGRQPRIYVFQVIPFKVHSSIWQSPTTTSKGTTKIRRELSKVYNYLYTGRNKDVLEFDIRYNTRFLTNVPLTKGKDTPDQQEGDGNSATNNQNAESTTLAQKDGKEETAEERVFPIKSVQDSDIPMITTGMRGTDASTKDIIAREFHQALINSNVDLVRCRLKIMGDPWFLSDSGMGNYQSEASAIMFNDKDGTMDYVRSFVYIQLNFRTPYDYSNRGLLEGGMVGEASAKVPQFSGLYRVTKVEHDFSEGQFTQTLEILRQINQTGEDRNDQPDSADNQGGLEQKDSTKDNNKPGDVNEGGSSTKPVFLSGGTIT